MALFYVTEDEGVATVANLLFGRRSEYALITGHQMFNLF